mmetsp:Transcript_41587/g.98587  ORF Transcript_41587/g.98587 Transcript_41587/m.98587 type:complete len:236 (+) Transcript_41587:469-1176(+)
MREPLRHRRQPPLRRPSRGDGAPDRQGGRPDGGAGSLRQLQQPKPREGDPHPVRDGQRRGRRLLLPVGGDIRLLLRRRRARDAHRPGHRGQPQEVDPRQLRAGQEPARGPRLPEQQEERDRAVARVLHRRRPPHLPLGHAQQQQPGPLPARGHGQHPGAEPLACGVLPAGRADALHGAGVQEPARVHVDLSAGRLRPRPRRHRQVLHRRLEEARRASRQHHPRGDLPHDVVQGGV